MEKIKIVIGVAIIIASFVYIIRSKTSMLDNMMQKTKKEYEQKQAIKEKAYKVVDGQADAFDTIAEGVKEAVKPVKASYENKEKQNM